MFQSFDDRERPHARVRSAWRNCANGSPRKDSTASSCRAPTSIRANMLPPRSERLQWLTGFSGSAGVAIVLADRAIIFVDGRYTLQVRDQTDPQVFTIESLVDNPPPKWIKANLGKGARLGFDPWLHTIRRRQGADEGRRQRRTPSWFRWTPTRSTSFGPTGRSRRSRRSRSIRSTSPANLPRTSWRGSQPRSPRKAPRMRC